ncbi:dipeptidase PepV [Alicyclobacillaceae bacterium I2511]|nr:dipeptidase PepV [Alicyclobacillaceae bacterium I2511]
MFDDFVAQHEREMVDTLQTLLQIPSVLGPALPHQPFGTEIDRALQSVLQLAEQYELVTCNVDGYAGHVEYGEGAEYVGVLCHLDVVPAGEGWTTPAFSAAIREGRIYGRGAIDDKGPSLSALWGLIAIKALGLQPRRKIRIIFGLDEESEWRCVKQYFQKESFPLGGFTPDADFPLVFAEKGLVTLKLVVSADVLSMSPRVVRFEGGERVNMVPDLAVAVVECHSETAALEWQQAMTREAKSKQVDVDVMTSGSQIELNVRGISAHGSTPHQGRNAICLLAGLLSSQPIANVSLWRFLAQQDTSGKSLGIEISDEVMGPLTVNLGMSKLTGEQYTCWFDVRYPVNVRPDDLITRCVAYVSDKWNIDMVHQVEPLYMPLAHPVAQVLQDVYRQETGDDAGPIAIGGATYARVIPNAVAFGPVFPGQRDVAHQPDESWDLQDYLRCVKIYARAMLELANHL